MSTPNQPVYLTDARFGFVYERIAEVDGFTWVRRVDDGTLDTLPTAMLTPYDPRPRLGETWKDPNGQDVIVVGKFPIDGQTHFYTVPYMAEDGPPNPPVLPMTPWRRRDLTPIIKRARRRGDVIPPEAATP